MSELQPGRYRHYKGKDYEVVRLVRHSETEEELVLYRTLYGDLSSLYGESSWWVRPRAMFAETVVVDGAAVPRFRYLGPMAAE